MMRALYISSLVTISASTFCIQAMESSAKVQEPHKPVFAVSKHLTPVADANAFFNYLNNYELRRQLYRYASACSGYKFAKESAGEFAQLRPIVVIEPNEIGQATEIKDMSARLSGIDEIVGYRTKAAKNSVFMGKVLSADCVSDGKSPISKITAQIVGNEVKVTTAVRDASNPTVTTNEEWTIAPMDEGKKNPSSIAIDPYRRAIFVGTKSGIISIYSAETQKEESALQLHTAQITDIRLFLTGSCFVTKDEALNTYLWAVGDEKPRVRLNAISHGHDYVFDGGIVRSHYGESQGHWIPDMQVIVSKVLDNNNGKYVTPLNYLKGNALAAPAYAYALLLQWVMLQQPTKNTEIEAIVKMLPQATIRSVIDPSVLKSFDACLKEQAARLGLTCVSHSPFSNITYDDELPFEKVSEKATV